MKKFSSALLMIGIIVILAAGLIGTLIFMKTQPPPGRGVAPITNIAPLEPDSAQWGINFPQEYSTFLKTKDNSTPTTFGGSNKRDKLAEDPRLLRLFAGYPFSLEYNDDRGHMWALEDVNTTKRLNDKTPGTCYSCKSSDNPGLWAEMGMAEYDKMKFADLGTQINHTIGCANCHEAGTMRLVVTNPALDEALKAQGKDWQTFTRQEMRTVVCANCHVEYYFKGDDKYLTFPWEDGTRIEQIAQYYTDLGFSDWDHPDSGAPMIKMQHPDYELFTADSTHYKAGVACADCHMPYTRDGAAKFSDHNVRSPLLNAETACGACHTDVAYVTNRVATIQDQVYTTMLNAEDAIIAAIDAIKAAKDAGGETTLLTEAQDLHRQAQLRWDFIAAENSMGFHNPEEALRILAAATDLARQAQVKAILAAP